jgi:pimeloyl-ACP methyl ester carboxylesterase
MLTTTSADGTNVQAIDEGQGRPIVLVGPGFDYQATQNARLAKELVRDFRVLRLLRRQYRVDLKTDVKRGIPRATAAQEVADIEAVVNAIGGGPVLLYGHSSGAVIALEALVASPYLYAGAVVFEPAAVIDADAPLGGKNREILDECWRLIESGKNAKAVSKFLTGPIRINPLPARLAGLSMAAVKRYRALIPCQINDCEVMDEVGVRLDAYATIQVPVMMLGGEINPDRPTTSNPNKNPAHIGERLNAVTKVLPNAEQVIMHGQSHSAHRRAPKEVAQVIRRLCDRVMPVPVQS